MEVIPDYVQILVFSHPKTAPLYIVKMLNGISGRWLMMKCSELKQGLWKDNL
ncbi:MAG TPA: hypothetical protein GXX20_09940 [Clostridiaceae bacterium]|nr:hypothetical protein [Clostridiaceae bacterium]